METNNTRPDLKDVDSCKACDHFCYDNLEGIGKCKRFNYYFSFIDPRTKICNLYTK